MGRRTKTTFEKGHKRVGGRVKGVPNHATLAIKDLLNRELPQEDQARLWHKHLNNKDPHIAIKAFEMANHYLYGKPVQPIVGEELAPPIRIDISAIPKHRVKA
jgi:hypothetical protein